MKRFLLFTLIGFSPVLLQAQILGGGTEFANAVAFNPSWLTGCPNGATILSNQKVFEPTDPIDPCAPAPACATGTVAADVWFSFVAQATTATIVINPSGGFDAAIQAFSGSSCPGLTEIGCKDGGGNNATESLDLTGLSINTTYYFRIFGANNNLSNRTGTYTFCGSTGLGATVLPVNITRFTASLSNSAVNLLWTTNSESLNDRFIIEKSVDATNFSTIGTVAGAGTSNHSVDYNFVDPTAPASISYYRLKQVDVNGNFKYSAIIPVRKNQKLLTEVIVSPNPVVDKLNVTVESETAAQGVIRVLNANGAELYRSTKQLLKGTNVFTISSLGNLAKGVYTVQLLVDSRKVSSPFIVN